MYIMRKKKVTSQSTDIIPNKERILHIEILKVILQQTKKNHRIIIDIYDGFVFTLYNLIFINKKKINFCLLLYFYK